MTMDRTSNRPRGAATFDAAANRKPISGVWMRTLAGAVRHMEVGQLTLIGPNGGREVIAAPKPGPQATLQIKRVRAVRRLFTSGDVGFAESYLAGDWDSPDLAALIELAA